MANLSNINNKFLVTTGGNVLIGKTAVTGTSKLQVSGSLLIGTDISSGIPLVVQETTADGFAIGFMRNTNATNGNGLVIDVNSTAGAYIQDWRQASTVKMRLLQNGNLGIGTDSPGAKLEIAGTAEARYLHVDAIAGFAGISSTMAAMVEFDNDGDGNNVTIKTNNSVRTDAAPFSVWTEANSRFIIRNDGNVGIGITNPGAQLDIVGPSGGSAILKLQRNGVGAYQYFVTDIGAGAQQLFCDAQQADSGFVFRTRNASNATINTLYLAPSGNVGIGTASPQALLDVTKVGDEIYDFSQDLGQRSGTATIHINNNSTTVGSFGQIMYDSDGSNQGIARIVFIDSGTASVDTAFVNEINNTKKETLRIKANGNVGIGTDSPTTALTIGKAISPTAYGEQASMIEFKSYYTGYDTETVKSAIYSGVSSQTTLQTTRGFMSFWTADYVSGGGQSLTEKMRIESNGNVGIGTTSLTGKLTVEATGNHLHLRNSNAASGRYWNFDPDLNSRLYVVSNTGAGVYLDYASTSWSSTSDESLKENIKPLENVLDKIKDYRCVEYNFKTDNDKKIGFIAQDWENDFAPIVSKDDDGLLGMKYTETIPVLLKAIQELKAEIELLKSK